MKKILLTMAMGFSLLLFIGCDILKKEGTLTILTMKNISIYVDGEFKTDAGESTKLTLKEGKHKIKIIGLSADGDWKYEAAEEEVLIGANVEKTISIIPTMYPTEQKIKKDEEAKVNNEELNKITKEKLKDIANRVYK